MPQTNYQVYMDRGFEGEVITAEPTHIRTGFNTSGATIPFGRIVVKGTGDKDCVLAAATGGIVQGVATKTEVHEKDYTTGIAAYLPKREMNILQKGTVLMQVEGTVTAGGAVYFRHTANGSPATFEGIGKVRANADTAKADLLAGAKFLEAGVAGDLVRVAFNFV